MAGMLERPVVLERLSRRSKATIFILVFIPLDIVAALAAVGYWSPAQPTSTDLVLAAALLLVLIACEAIAAYLTFYMKVDRPMAETR